LSISILEGSEKVDKGIEGQVEKVLGRIPLIGSYSKVNPFK
jgi:hypothetical protein